MEIEISGISLELCRDSFVTRGTVNGVFQTRKWALQHAAEMMFYCVGTERELRSCDPASLPRPLPVTLRVPVFQWHKRVMS